MGRKSFNLDPLKSVGRGALHVAGIITVATIGASALMGALFGLVSFGKWMTAPSEEELKQQELDESISSYEAMDIEYKLMGSNIVRVNEGELTHYFHFSSGHVYAQNDPKEHNPPSYPHSTQNTINVCVILIDLDSIIPKNYALA